MKNLIMRDNRGFALIELLTVFAIIAILTSIAVTYYYYGIKQARAASCESNRHNIEVRALSAKVSESTANFENENNDIVLPVIDARWQCPSDGIYVWLITDPDHLDYPKVGCSVHFAELPEL